MIIDLRKLISVSLVPVALLLLAGFYLAPLSRSLPHSLQMILPWLPYAVFFTCLVLGWIFHHSREFNLALLGIIVFIALNKYLWDPGLKVDTRLAYLLLVTLVPINYLLNLFMKERGILNHFGIRRFVLLAIQLYLVAWLLEHPQNEIRSFFTQTYFSFATEKYTPISQPVLGLIVITLVILFYRLLRTSSSVYASVFYSFIAFILALHFYQQPELASLYMVLTGLLIIIGITQNAYSLAYLDELTNLPSRRAMNQSIATLGKRYCIAMVDVDHFKKFNDRYGHDVGDQVLKKLASQLRQVRGGKAFRYGGEEFLLLFANKNLHEVRLYCDTLRKKIEKSPFMLRSKKRPKKINPDKPARAGSTKALTITVSIGIAENNSELSTSAEVIKQADKALYKAKKKGRNQVAI